MTWWLQLWDLSVFGLLLELFSEHLESWMTSYGLSFFVG